MKIFVDLRALDNAMIYEPLWSKDKCISKRIICSNIITQKELLDIAQLCIRYQHRCQIYEIKTL